MQVKPEYEIVDEFPKIAQKLVKKYPEVFLDLDVKSVKCVAVMNKDRKENNLKVWDMKPVHMPMRMDSPYAYYLIVYMSDWSEMEEKNRALLIADALLTLPTTAGEGGPLKSFDLKDFNTMVRTFGVDYLTRQDVPNILEKDVKWVR